ncbi:hypothetical protein BDR06DRAFT_983647 [Suillus hirtellus]|nr:hypothetical protein BDR06DRAFT_983647 [Suillus hirtellus]
MKMGKSGKTKMPVGKEHHKLFHYEPYQLQWHPSHLDVEVSIYRDLYTLQAFHEAHMELQNFPAEPNWNLLQVVAGMMFWSNATQLTLFGNAKLWSTYMYFGNESKYHCCKPSCNLSNHIVYFKMVCLPMSYYSFKDFAGRKGMTSGCLTHCHRELFHKQWNILLDDEFLEAYKHRIVILCCNSITQRFYPRIFTYLADYPEKVLIATVRNLGGCPCPCCLIPKKHIQNMGKPQDRIQCRTLACSNAKQRTMVSTAQSLIYEKNFVVRSAPVEQILKSQSWVPTLNTFSDHLGSLGFNIFCALVVDLLYKFKIGA